MQKWMFYSHYVAFVIASGVESCQLHTQNPNSEDNWFNVESMVNSFSQHWFNIKSIFFAIWERTTALPLVHPSGCVFSRRLYRANSSRQPRSRPVSPTCRGLARHLRGAIVLPLTTPFKALIPSPKNASQGSRCMRREEKNGGFKRGKERVWESEPSCFELSLVQTNFKRECDLGSSARPGKQLWECYRYVIVWHIVHCKKSYFTEL